MVEYIRPVRPNAAPTKLIDSYYRPLLDNRESQALSKLASAIGNLRGPIQDLANTAVQARRNQLQMMKMEQDLQLQEQDNAFKLYKMEQDFALTQARDNYSDTMEAFKAVNDDISRQIQLDQLRMEQGLPVYGTDAFVGTSAGKVTMANEEAIRNKPLDDGLYGILSSAAAQTGLEVRVFSGGQPGIDEGGQRTGTQRHDHGSAADVHLIDQATGQIIPVDGSDPRAIKFAQVARGLGIVGIGGGEGYMGGNALHLDTVGTSKGGGNYWGKKGGTPYSWIPELFTSSMADNIKEYAAADSVQYTMAMNAKRTSLLNQLLTDRGISEENRSRIMESVERDNAFAVEKSMILAEGADRAGQMAQYQASRDIADQSFAEIYEMMSDDALLAMSTDDFLDNLAGQFAEAGAKENFDPNIIASVNTAEALMKTSAYSTFAKQRGEAFANNYRAVKASGAIANLSEFRQKARGTITTETLAQVYREEVAKTGLAPEEIAATFVENVEIAQLQAASAGATIANIENAKELTAALDELFQADAFAGVDEDMAKRIGGLVEAEAANRADNTVKAFNLAMQEVAQDPVQQQRLAYDFAEKAQFAYPSMSVEDRASVVRSLETAASDMNATITEQNESVLTPIRPTKTVHSFSFVEQIGSDGQTTMIPRLTSRQEVISSSDKKELINKKQQAALPQLTEDLRNLGSDDANTKSIAASNLQQSLQLAQTNGYATGLYGKLADELIAGGDITPGNIGPLVDLMTLSTNSSFDFAGSPLLVAIGEVVGYQGDRRAKIGQYLTSYAPMLNVITDDHIDAAISAYSNLPLQAQREEGLKVLMAAMPEIKGNPADIDAVIAKHANANKFRPFSINTPGDYRSTSYQFSQQTGIDMVVTDYTLPSTKRHLRDEFGMSQGEVEKMVDYGLQLKSLMLQQSDTAKLSNDGSKKFEVFVSNDALYFSLDGGGPAVVQTPSGDVVLPAMTRSQGLDNLATTQVQFFDSSTQSMGSMFLLDQMGSGTFDKENVGGDLSLRVTYADGSEGVIGASPDQLIPVGTKGNDFFDGRDVGGIVYGISLDGGGREIQSVAVSFDGQIGMQPPGQVISSHSRLSMTTIHDAFNSNKIFRDFKELN
jgi:hypothetical protein